MFTVLFIACLFILTYFAIIDLHSSVALQMKWSPESKISRTARLAYTIVQSIKERKYIARA